MRNNMLAMAALMAMGGSGMLAEAIEPRPTDVPVKPRRNYDLQGPEPKAGPPSAFEADMPSRQQRRWQERQAKKNG